MNANSADKKFADASDRNKVPICEALQQIVFQPDQENRVLEIASGTGQHAEYMCSKISNLKWQPTEVDEMCLKSITAWTEAIPNVMQPLQLDASLPSEEWPVPELHYDVVYNCNMIHISPYKVLEGLIAGASRTCKKDGFLVIYGPFKINGKATTESNAVFDEWLQSSNPLFGLRDFEDVDSKATEAGFTFICRKDMPANNFLCAWKKL